MAAVKRNRTSEKTVGRLSLYRRILVQVKAKGVDDVYSYELAHLARNTAAQVRRDLMVVGYSGSPSKGYSVAELVKSIDDFLNPPDKPRVVLVGVGEFGRAVLAYFGKWRNDLSIVAAFDKDQAKVGQTIHGCRCYHVDRLLRVTSHNRARIGALAVPGADAQTTAYLLTQAGVRGLLNFSNARLDVPPHVYVEDMDMDIALEKVMYFANHSSSSASGPERCRAIG